MLSAEKVGGKYVVRVRIPIDRSNDPLVLGLIQHQEEIDWLLFTAEEKVGARQVRRHVDGPNEIIAKWATSDLGELTEATENLFCFADVASRSPRTRP